MTEKTSLWNVFVGLASLILFILWAVYAYLSNPEEIPVEPIVMATIATLTIIGAWVFRVNAEVKRKNINVNDIRAGGSVSLGDSGLDGSEDFSEKNFTSGKIKAKKNVRIGDTQ